MNSTNTEVHISEPGAAKVAGSETSVENVDGILRETCAFLIADERRVNEALAQ